MRGSLAIHAVLIAKVQALTGSSDKSALVKEAQKALVERASARRVALLGSSEPALSDVPGQQTEPASSCPIPRSGSITSAVATPG